MSNARGLALLAAIAAWLLSSRSSSASSAGGSSSPASGGGGSSPAPLPAPAGGWPVATRTGYTGADAWRRYAREVYQLALDYLAAQGADRVEQEVGALLAAVVGQLETSGRAEYDFNVGNIRPVGTQARSRNPNNGLLFRAFPSRAEGVAATVRLARSGARYRDAFAEAVRLAREGEPLEPLIGALLATLHDRGYDEAPQRLSGAAREQWVQDRARYATRVADLVVRAIGSSAPVGDEQSQPATSQATQDASLAVAQTIRAGLTPVAAGTPAREVE